VNTISRDHVRVGVEGGFTQAGHRKASGLGRLSAGDWAGSSMSIPPISAPYQATVGASARAMKAFDKTADSDPAKVARLVLTIAELEDPPLRILAGSDAYEYGREVWRARLESDARWESLSRSTDDDDTTSACEAQRGSSLPQVRT
jgi:hypothetical protein